ncbi:MAG: PilZ domain-containing protein [Thermodesulfobacteriota bacterium]|nr:PilZ domain-containing protein [Thermodesulfobacteriota bacterium]
MPLSAHRDCFHHLASNLQTSWHGTGGAGALQSGNDLFEVKTMIPMMKKNEVRLERRQHARFNVNGVRAYAMVRRDWPPSPLMGNIVDIGIGGLSFHYIGKERPSSASSYLDILLGNSGFCLHEMPVRTISDIEADPAPGIRPGTRQCGLQFGDLTEEQKSHVRYFIQAYTTADPEA